MNVPLITWVCIAVAMIMLVLIRIFLSAHEHMKESNKLTPHSHVAVARPRHKILEIGNEREEFFAPGDRLPGNPDYYGDDDN